MKDRFGKFGDVIWVLVLGAQGGLLLAIPVLGGLALGYYLDLQNNSLPWFTVGLTLVGAVIGPISLHRFMKTVVKRRMNRDKTENEETPE